MFRRAGPAGRGWGGFNWAVVGAVLRVSRGVIRHRRGGSRCLFFELGTDRNGAGPEQASSDPAWSLRGRLRWKHDAAGFLRPPPPPPPRPRGCSYRAPGVRPGTPSPLGCGRSVPRPLHLRRESRFDGTTVCAGVRAGRRLFHAGAELPAMPLRGGCILRRRRRERLLHPKCGPLLPPSIWVPWG